MIISGPAAPGTQYKRLCARYYVKHSTDYVGYQSATPGQCNANKVISFKWGDNQTLGITDGRGGGDYGLYCGVWNDCSDKWLPESGDDIGLNECRGRWCMVEMCAGSSGAAQSGSDITIEAWIGIVDGPNAGRTKRWAPYTVHGPQRSQFEALHIANMYREGNCPGWREYSHAMMAGWTTNAGQRIGAASELGSGGTTGPLTPPGKPTLAGGQ